MWLHTIRGLFLFTLCLHVFAQGVGSTEQEVLKAYGPPQLQRDGSAGAIWIYSNGTRLVLSKGVVVETNVSAKQAAPEKSEARSDYTTTTRQPAPTPGAPADAPGDRHDDPWSTNSPPSPIGAALTIIGLLLGCGLGIWHYVIAFKESVGWGLACLFLPLASVIFTIRHWDEAKAPFLWIVFGAMPLIFLGTFMSMP
ncbi:MAG: hypothetical protein ABII82_20480 [Verrucomicrobiota bacterium]